MKTAKEFRQIAWQALRNNLKPALIAGLIVIILCGYSGALQVDFEKYETGARFTLEILDSHIYTFKGDAIEGLIGFILAHYQPLSTIYLVFLLLYTMLSSIISIGHARFNLDLIDGADELRVSTLFDYFKHWRVAIWSGILRGIYSALWHLLFVIPGIIAHLSYAMTDYILCENPELSADEAISLSKAMMYGHCWRLFCLEFSFIGWMLLAMLTLNIGMLWVVPYQQAAIAAFYREVSAAYHENTEA